MDYKKKYEDAVKKLEKFFTNNDDRILYKDDIENVFPELKESEDVRIRNEIIQSIQDNMCVIHKDKCIAWLEKQGEQKTTWSEEDKKGLDDALWAIQQARTIVKNENDMGNLRYAENWLKSIKEIIKGE